MEDYEIATNLDRDWRSEAACKGINDSGQANYFFPTEKERPENRKLREEIARKICGNCVVLENCRDYISKNAESGFWAGLNEYERHDLGMPILSCDTTLVKRKKYNTKNSDAA